MNDSFEQNICKAEEWVKRVKKYVLPNTNYTEYVTEQINLLEWLIERAKANEQ